MATIAQVKEKMLEKLARMDLDKMTLMDAGQYASILKTLSEVSEKTYAEMLSDTLRGGFNGCYAGYAPVRLGDIQGGENDGM